MMGMKWVPYVVVFLIILAVYLSGGLRAKDEHADRSIVKKTRSNSNSVMRVDSKAKDENKALDRSLASEVSQAGSAVVTGVRADNPLDTLENPYLANTKSRSARNRGILKSISGEKREHLDLQLVGNGRWSIFSDLQVSKHAIHNSLFAMGPYHVSRKDYQVSGTSMGLIIDENQNSLGVLTGRVVIKVRDLYDMDPITKEYGLKIDNVSAEIRTAYVDASHVGGFSKLNQNLKTDQRIERFYFEVVKTDWVKN